MQASFGRYGALLLSCMAALACNDVAVRSIVNAAAAANDQDRGIFAKSVREYQSRRPYKALALARGDSNWAWGWASADTTMQQALADAFQHCEHSRLNMHITTACRLYAVNDEVVIDYTKAARWQVLIRYQSVDPNSVP